MSGRNDAPETESEADRSEGNHDEATETSPQTWAIWGGGPGWRLPFSGKESTDRVGHGGTGASGRRWTEGYTLLIVVGAILFLFPEPVTSAVGALLAGAGVLGWLAEEFR